jgi:4-hydroxybenzoate polyprenyltransferase
MIQPQLNAVLIVFFILCTVCIVISANVINDIFDLEIDKINKPQSPIASGEISANSAWKIYFASLFLGFILAFQVAFAIQKIYLISVYILMQLLMFYYSKSFKKKGLLGNIIVAISIAFVSLIMLLSEPQLNSNDLLKNCLIIILGFSVFVFLINLARELVKDLEDMKGDESNNLSTFPIKHGMINTKKLILFLIIILIFCLIGWTVLMPNLDFRMKTYPIIILLGPLGLSALKVYKAEDKIHFSKISKLLKYIILLGLIYFFLIAQFYYH